MGTNNKTFYITRIGGKHRHEDIFPNEDERLLTLFAITQVWVKKNIGCERYAPKRYCEPVWHTNFGLMYAGNLINMINPN